MNKLILVRGLPGSGKSTYANTLAKSLGCIHLEADMYFVRDGKYEWNGEEIRDAHKWCFSMTEKCIIAGMDVVVSNTFTTIKEVKPYLDLIPNTEVIRCTGDYGSVHGVPTETYLKMKQRFVDLRGEKFYD